MKRLQTEALDQEQGRQVKRRTFKCLKCLKYARSPVVTHCGHIFCWQCLYKSTITSSKCPECAQIWNSAESYPIYTDFHQQQAINHQVQQQPSSQNKLSSHNIAVTQTLQLPPRPVAKHRQKILNPNMIGAGLPLSSNSLPSNLNIGKLLAGHVFMPPLGINTFSTIEEGNINDEDYNLGQKYKIKMHIAIVCTILLIVYFLV